MFGEGKVAPVRMPVIFSPVYKNWNKIETVAEVLLMRQNLELFRNPVLREE